MTRTLHPRISTTGMALVGIVSLLPQFAAGAPPIDPQEAVPRATQVAGVPEIKPS